MSQLTGSVTPPWHALAAEEVTGLLEVDPRIGLSSAEAARRLERHGHNELTGARQEPRWRAFLRQFPSPMILILMVAAVVSAVVAGQLEIPIAILVVVLLNAIIGFVQESRAESALEALRRMTTTTAVVRRDGRIVRLDADELVPGDVVVLEAGDRVPADGRLRLPIDGSTDVRIFARRVQCIRPVGTPDLTWAAEATRYPGAHPVSRSEWASTRRTCSDFRP